MNLHSYESITILQQFHFSYWWKEKTTNYGKKYEEKIYIYIKIITLCFSSQLFSKFWKLLHSKFCVPKKNTLPTPRHLKFPQFSRPKINLNSASIVLISPNYPPILSIIPIESPMSSLSKINITTPAHYSHAS